MSSNNPNQDDGDYDYGDTTNSGYDDTTTGTGYDDDGYDYGDTTTTGYGDDTTTGYGDDTTYGDQTTATATGTPTGGHDGDDTTYGDETANSSRFNDDNYEDSDRFNPGVGEQYDASRPDHLRASYTQGSGTGPAGGTREHNDYDYDSNYDDTVDDDADADDDDDERVPFRPSVRNYDHFDKDGDFKDEYDSDEDEEYNKETSFYKGREQYEYRNDEAEEERRSKKKKKRNFTDESTGKKIVAAVCCCCICFITILLLVLFLLVFREDESRADGGSGRGGGASNTNRPTPRPTYPIPPALRPALDGDVFQPWIHVTDQPTISAYPTNVASSNPTHFPTGIPSPKPTISPAPTRIVPPTITLEANADTYIFVDGFAQYEAFGKEDSFLVQNGLAEYFEFGDAMGLISFDLSTLPTKIQMLDYNTQAILRLKHLPVNEKFNTRKPATLSIRKLVSTAMRVESIHGGMMSSIPDDSILGENDVTVGINQDLVLIDISDLLYPVNFTNTGYDRNQLLLMIFNNSTEQGDPAWTELAWQDQAGDRFKSIESGAGPSLTITYVPK